MKRCASGWGTQVCHSRMHDSAPSAWCRTRFAYTNRSLGSRTGETLDFNSQLPTSNLQGLEFGVCSLSFHRTAFSPDLHPDVYRGQSSKVTAAPLVENVTPRAIREVGRRSASRRSTWVRGFRVSGSKTRS